MNSLHVCIISMWYMTCSVIVVGFYYKHNICTLIAYRIRLAVSWNCICLYYVSALFYNQSNYCCCLLIHVYNNLAEDAKDNTTYSFTSVSQTTVRITHDSLYVTLD